MKRITTFASFALATYAIAGSSLRAQTAPTPAAAPTNAASVQAQQQSLGDYVRQMHSKDANTAKAKAKVFDNDNLPTDQKISVVGQTTEAANSAADAGTQPGASKDSVKPSTDDAKRQEEWKGWHDKVSSQKEQIDLASRELDVLQREYQIRAAEMYADAGNRLRNSGTWDKQDADYKEKIADKQKAVDEAKQKLDDMQEEARKAGVPASALEQQSTQPAQ